VNRSLTPGHRARAAGIAAGMVWLSACLSPGQLTGQEGSLRLDAGASYSLPPASVTATSTPYLHLGGSLRVPIGSDAGWFLAGATGLSLESAGASWFSVLTGASAAFAVAGPLYIDLAASAEMFKVGEPYPYRAALLQGEPALRLELGASTLRIAGWGGVGQSWVQPVGGPMQGTRPGDEVESDLWSWGGRLSAYHRLGAVEPRAGLEVYTATQGDYLGGWVGVRFEVFQSLWDVNLGLWDTPTGSETQLGIGLVLPIGRDFSAQANFGRYAPDPLLDTPAAGSAGALVAWTAARFGESGPRLFEIESSVPPSVRFMLEMEDAATVALVGGITGWEKVPMVRKGDVWTVTLDVEPGIYRFGFEVDGTWYIPDDADGRTVDEWGVEQATLVVPHS
jgi:hypothetical protein